MARKKSNKEYYEMLDALYDRIHHTHSKLKSEAMDSLNRFRSLFTQILEDEPIEKSKK